MSRKQHGSGFSKPPYLPYGYKGDMEITTNANKLLRMHVPFSSVEAPCSVVFQEYYYWMQLTHTCRNVHKAKDSLISIREASNSRLNGSN